MSIEQAEAQLKKAYVPKLSKVLPAKKVARYMQIENKIRAIVKYDLASARPPRPIACRAAARVGIVSVRLQQAAMSPLPPGEEL